MIYSLRRLLGLLAFFGLASCDEWSSLGDSDPSGDSATHEDGTQDEPDCVADGPFGAIVCERFYTGSTLPEALAVGWLDTDGLIAELAFDKVRARADGAEWQDNPTTVTEHSKAANGNSVIGLTLPGSPRDGAAIEIDGTVWFTDGTSVDLCDLETGLIVLNNDVALDGYTCGFGFKLDW